MSLLWTMKPISSASVLPATMCSTVFEWPPPGRRARTARPRGPSRAPLDPPLDGGVELRLAGDQVRRFDGVVVATNAGQALRLLEDPSEDERRLLGLFGTTENDTVLHTDERFLPRRVSTRGSWNYQLRDCGQDDGRPTMTYYLNKLQRLDGSTTASRSIPPPSRPGADHPPLLLPPPARDARVDARPARASAPQRPAVHRLRRRLAGLLLPRGRAALRPRRRSGFRSELVRSTLYTGTVMHARKTPKENVFRYRVCSTYSTSTSYPSSTGACGCSAGTEGTWPACTTATTSTSAPTWPSTDRGRPDPAPDEPACPRLRVQPGQLLLLLSGRRARVHCRPLQSDPLQPRGERLISCGRRTTALQPRNQVAVSC